MSDRFSMSGDKPYCKPHQSHFCPCVKPEIYDPLNAKDQEYIRGWEAIAPIVPFAGAKPGLDVDPSTKARADDPWTSHNAADAVAKMGKAKNQRWQLLYVFASTLGDEGLTSEEAATFAPGVDIRSEYSTRCSELQRLGMLRATGKTRKGMAGVERDVYKITDRGMEAIG